MNPDIKTLFFTFLKLGFISFGGPVAHIALMERELVNKLKWISHEKYLNFISMSNLIPGPNSTEVALHIGYNKAGIKGMIVCGLAFITPAVLLVILVAYLIQSFGSLNYISSVIEGIKPTLIVVILFAAYSFSKNVFRKISHYVEGVIILILCILGFDELLALFAGGIMGLIYENIAKEPDESKRNIINLFNISPDLIFIFLTFLKIGSLIYGSGYVLFSFYESEFVSNGLLTKDILLDAILAGEITPGPLFSSSAYIGYIFAGIPGALTAAAGIFLPAFIFVFLISKFYSYVAEKKNVKIFLNYLNVSSVALIIFMCYLLSIESFVNSQTELYKLIIMLLFSGFLLFKFKNINTAIVILLSLILSAILSLF